MAFLCSSAYVASLAGAADGAALYSRERAGWSHFTALTICLQRALVPRGHGEMNVVCAGAQNSFSATSRSDRAQSRTADKVRWGWERSQPESAPRSVCLAVLQTDTRPLLHQRGPRQAAVQRLPKPEVWSVLSDSACALQAPGNESAVAEGRQPRLCERLSQASLAAPLLYYPSCSL